MIEGLAIELAQATAAYGRGAREAVSQATLGVREGELVAVTGPNGAGKTTLLRVASGALGLEKGEARLYGRPLREMDAREIARSLAVVAQRDTVAFGFTVRDVVMMGRAPHQTGWMRAGDRDREVVLEAMRRCDVDALAERKVTELSGGEQKRVAIARALAQEPKVLLLDEPAAFLDVRHQIDLYELLAEETKKGRACVVVMHDLNAAAQYADKIVLMKAGRIVATGAVEEVMTYARLKEAFDADLYVGVNEITGDRFFLPMRRK